MSSRCQTKQTLWFTLLSLRSGWSGSVRQKIWIYMDKPVTTTVTSIKGLKNTVKIATWKADMQLILKGYFGLSPHICHQPFHVQLLQSQSRPADNKCCQGYHRYDPGLPYRPTPSPRTGLLFKKPQQNTKRIKCTITFKNIIVHTHLYFRQKITFLMLFRIIFEATTPSKPRQQNQS